jgi:hypothetical protein
MYNWKLSGPVTSLSGGPSLAIQAGSADTPCGNYSFSVRIVTGGALGGAVFQYSLNDGRTLPVQQTWSPLIVTSPGSSYFFPVSGTGVTITFASGVYVAGAVYQWTTSPSIVLTRSAAGQASPRWFGAKGDFIADDTAAIQGTEGATARTGGCIVFPPGRYKTTQTIFRMSNVEWQGALGGSIGAYVNAETAIWFYGIPPDPNYHAILDYFGTCFTRTSGIALYDRSGTGMNYSKGILVDSDNLPPSTANAFEDIYIGDCATGMHFGTSGATAAFQSDGITSSQFLYL